MAGSKRSPVFQLSAKRAFDLLEDRDKFYAHHMSRAAFHGTRILLRQVSPESEDIFDLIMEIAENAAGDWDAFARKHDLDHGEMDSFIDYAARFLDSMGNYSGHGDKKLLPAFSQTSFHKACSCSPIAMALCNSVETVMFDAQPTTLGLSMTGGVSGYFVDSPGMTKQEADDVSQFLVSEGVMMENTRLRKTKHPDSPLYEVMVASSEAKETSTIQGHPNDSSSFQYTLRYGDHQDEITEILRSIEHAEPFAQNDLQHQRLSKVKDYLRGGDVNSHKSASVPWLKDSAPTVETVVGFIEAYRDPLRREWMGLVAVQNKAETAMYSALVASADQLIALLPWNVGYLNGVVSPFENSEYHRPSFMSLEILSFSVSNCWGGIALPNFPDVVREHGRKNLYFANRALAIHMLGEDAFISNDCLEDYKAHRSRCLTLNIAVHELIGHGCGKILEQTDQGFNFDAEHPPQNPITGKPVTTWYKPNQSFKSVFGSISSTISECLAEGISLYLISSSTVGRILQQPLLGSEKFLYQSFLQMLSLGLRGLSTFDVEQQKWGQSHDRARFAIFRYMHERGAGLLKVSELEENGTPTLKLFLDRSEVLGKGRDTLGELINRLHIYRATADAPNGTQFIESLTAVDGIYEHWRRLVCLHEKPRPLFVQANTFVHEDRVELKEYDATSEGLIQSWQERAIPKRRNWKL